ncbi:MAG: hypothetical protein WDN31_04620 [Hyphomicrobium sp.]
MKVFRLVILGIVLFGLLPFVSLLVASTIADVAGCQLDMGGVVWPCVIAGHDFGGALQTLQSFGYGSFFTVPLLMVTVPAWLIVEAVYWLVRLRGATLG